MKDYRGLAAPLLQSSPVVGLEVLRGDVLGFGCFNPLRAYSAV